MVQVVGGWSVINGATPASFLLHLLLEAGCLSIENKRGCSLLLAAWYSSCVCQLYIIRWTEERMLGLPIYRIHLEAFHTIYLYFGVSIVVKYD